MRPRTRVRLILLALLSAALLAGPALAQLPDRPADASLSVEVDTTGTVPRNGTGTVPVNVTYWNEEGGAATRVDVHLDVKIPIADETVTPSLERERVTFLPDPTGGTVQRTVNLTLETDRRAPGRVAVEVTAHAEDAIGTVRRPDNASWAGLVEIDGEGPWSRAAPGAPPGSTGGGAVAPWHVLEGPWWLTSGVAVSGWTVGLALVAVAARPGDPRILAGALPVAAAALASSWVDPGGVQVLVGVPAVIGAIVGLWALHLRGRWDDAIGATFFASFVGVLVGSDLAAIVLGRVPAGQGLVIGGAGAWDALVVAPIVALLYLGFSVAVMAAVDRVFPGQGWLVDPPKEAPIRIEIRDR